MSFKLFIGCMFARKCLAADTPVMMADGTVRPVQNILNGDLIMGDDSKPRTVSATTSGTGNLYRVSRPDGTSYVVNENHILCLRFAGHGDLHYDDQTWSFTCFTRSHDAFTWEFQVKDYANAADALFAAERKRAAILPRPEYPQPGDIIDISVDRASRMPPSWFAHWRGYKMPVSQFSGRPALAVDELWPYTAGYTLLGHGNNIQRFENYMYSDDHQRRTFLAGVIDIHGAYSAARNEYQILLDKSTFDTDTSRAVALVIKSIAQTTGHECSIDLDMVTSITMTISGGPLDKIPVLARDKHAMPGYSLDRPIKIEMMRKPGDYYGFTLDGNGRFLLGDCTVTHNTSNMCDEIERYAIASKLCIIVKYANDTRFDDRTGPGGVMTHGGREHNRVPIVKTRLLADIYEEISEYEVIGIDEVQFYDDNVEIIQLLANSGKIVIASGLDATYRCKPFGRMAEVIAIAEDVVKLKAVCMRCSSSASFTMRISTDTDIEVIGGTDKYIAVCRTCMFNPSDA